MGLLLVLKTMSFIHTRTIYFQDTDAAGVVYFANILSICHEAYEASLKATDINLQEFFNNPHQAIPIVHADLDLHRPIYCGDLINIKLSPQTINESEFEINYQIFFPDRVNKYLAKAITRHVCIHPLQRNRLPLSESVQQWLDYYSS